NARVRRVAVATGLITTLAGTDPPGFSGDTGLATAAQLGGAVGVAVAPETGALLIADTLNHRVRAVSHVFPPLPAQTLAFAPLADKIVGDPPFPVSATASSGLAVSFSASGACTVAASTVTLTGAGTCTVTATQGGNASYAAAAPVAQTF